MFIVIRLARLSLVKSDKARAVEDSFIRAATNGHLKGKVMANSMNFVFA
jgi:DNA-binding TFAR19-related protein (PDSD5 family)